MADEGPRDLDLLGVTKKKPRWVWALFFLVLLLLVFPLVLTVNALFT
jgi:hypothetical protein